MKRILISLIALLSMATAANAMSYEQARREAFFLTDKMAYELNLTPEQYDAAYEINLDYLMGVSTVDDVFSDYWRRRNLDMSYILLKWQWDAFCAATYFYRPLYWSGGYWHFAIYSRYPRRNYFYFSRPTVYITYRGGHSWRSNGGRSYYHAHRDHFRKPAHNGGMRDRWNRGEYRGPRGGAGSSSRVTVNRPDNDKGFGSSRRGGSFKSNRTPSTTQKSGTNGTFRLAASSSRNSSLRSSGSRNTTSRPAAKQPSGTSSTRPSASGIRSNSFGGARSTGSFGSTRRTTPATNVSRSPSSGSIRTKSAPSNVRSGSFRSTRSSAQPATRSHSTGHSSSSRGGGFSGKR